jgi:CRISPR/Cas system CSM-associated protein Csm4 (group 5 of RAMP superfamily)
MGADCSLDNKPESNYNQIEKERNDNIQSEEQNIFSHLSVKNYKDYCKKLDIFKKKLTEIMKKVVEVNEFSVSKE